MLRVCAWCNGYLEGERGNETGGMVSHGICEHCLFTKYRRYYEKMKARGVLPSQRIPGGSSSTLKLALA